MLLIAHKLFLAKIVEVGFTEPLWPIAVSSLD